MTTLKNITQASQELKEHLKKTIYGQDDVIDQLIVTLLSGGHALLTGAPGLAKTMLIKHCALRLEQNFKRIQFTPDLTPFDILGGDTIQFDSQNPDFKKIVFAPGPIFSSFVLADEINRASPRTQSALLEAMQEHQITLNGKTTKLPEPFFVFATQNPIEHEGTFPLPEAQLDRFFMNIEVKYPDFDSEIRIASILSNNLSQTPMTNSSVILTAKTEVENRPISARLIEAAVRLIRNTRPEHTELGFVKESFLFGASPRASQALVLASKAYATLLGAEEVELKHIKEMAPSVLNHRCVMSYASQSVNMRAQDILKKIIEETLY